MNMHTRHDIPLSYITTSLGLYFFLCTFCSAAMTNEASAGAVLMPSFEKKVSVESFANMLCDIHARSYIILRSDTSKELVAHVQSAYEKQCESARARKEGREVIHLVAALDAEPSLMRYRMPRVAQTHAIGDTNALRTDASVRTSARTIASALIAAGIRINFAPVYDTGSNAAIIGARAFSPIVSTDAPKGAGVAGANGGQAEATRKANIFQSESAAAGIITAAKHFPGHGHARGDTHATLETIPATLPELENFTSAIAAHVPCIMVGHLVIKDTRSPEERAREKREVWESDGLPATLSKHILTDLLRTRLGFDGLVVTDSMSMGALNGYTDRSVRSLEAGADIILIPPDPRAAYTRILQKMNADPTFQRLVQSKAERIIDKLK